MQKILGINTKINQSFHKTNRQLAKNLNQLKKRLTSLIVRKYQLNFNNEINQKVKNSIDKKQPQLEQI